MATPFAKATNEVTACYLVKDDLNRPSYPQFFDDSADGLVTRTSRDLLQGISEERVVDNTGTTSFAGSTTVATHVN